MPYYYNESTEKLSWDKPRDMNDDGDTGDGQWFWIPDEEDGFLPAKHLGGDDFETKKGQRKQVKGKATKLIVPLKYSALSRLEQDLVLLDNLDDGMILYDLKERFLKNEIYSNIGTILVSVNPFQRLPLYTPEMIDRYKNKGTRQLPPHPFETADCAFKNIVQTQEDQSVLVSGESGAGKTEATKQVLSFLADVAGSSNSSGSSIEDKILSSNPILEAFGNAKTLRNDNSSRFGRFTEVILDKGLRISGAKIQNYLLEKSRVASQPPGERNYHAFAQLCSSPVCSEFGIQSAGDFHYLNQSGTLTVVGIDDGADFEEVQSSMSMVGLDEKEKRSILSIVGGILHLGNCHMDKAGDATDGAVVAPAALENACSQAANLFGIDRDTLAQKLVLRSVEIRSEVMTIPLRLEQANDNRDSLGKFIYEQLFNWLVFAVNRCLDGPGNRFIGILDIFGFEIFEQNSFEQLCINFTNEKLQQLFNLHTFKEEENVYMSEAINFPKIEFIDNQPILDLIEARGGIFTQLDDIVKGPGKLDEKDKKFSAGIDRQYAQNKWFTPSNRHRGIKFMAFTISHYAGDVIYNVSGFVEKNQDTLYQDLYDLMSGSSNSFIQQLFPVKSKEERSKHTLGKQFKGQLSSLMKVLHSTSPHYIRCIKPNARKMPGLMDGKMTLDQLKYSGIFEAVRIRKQGFPFRYTFKRFVERYKCLTCVESETKGKFRFVPLNASGLKEQGAELLVRSKQDFDHSAFQVGKTMYLFRAEQYRTLELCRSLASERVCSIIQSVGRGYLSRVYVNRVKSLRPILQKAIKSRDVNVLTDAIRKVNNLLGVYQNFSVAVAFGELKEAQDMKEALEQAERFSELLKQYAYADLQQDGNFELLFRTLGECEKLAELRPSDDFMALHKIATDQFIQWREFRMQSQLNDVMAELEREAMQTVYAECKRLKYEDARLQEIEKLVGLNETDLLKRQLKRAKETSNEDRAQQKEIALKDANLESFGDLFVFEKCGLLRDPDDYACVFFGAQKIAEGMCLHSPKPFPNSLTKLEGPARKTALKVNKAILGYMRDKKYQLPDTLACEILQTGNDNPDVRVEIYCQIMKQLIQNPNRTSVDYGWKLLSLCMQVFSAGPAFENYVLMFIKKQAPPAAKESLYQMCHLISFGNGQRVPHSAAEVSHLLTSAGVNRESIRR
jgi:myosin heavy subunit